MRYYITCVLIPGLLLSACSIAPGDKRAYNPDKEFSKLEQPDIPSIESSLLKSAQLKEAQGDYAQAASLYKQLTDKNPDNVDYILGLAENIRRNGDFNEAIIVYDELIAKDQKSLDAKEGKALAIMGQGEFQEASKLFEHIIQQDAHRWRTLNALAIMFTLKDMHEESMSYYRAALDHKPNNASILNNIGLSSAIARQYNTSLQYLQNAAKAARGNDARIKQIELNQALVYGISGDLDTSERIAARHLDGALLQNNLGLYAHLAQNDELAKSYLNMALSHSPSYYQNAWKNLEYLVEQGKGLKEIPNPKAKRVKVN